MRFSGDRLFTCYVDISKPKSLIMFIYPPEEIVPLLYGFNIMCNLNELRQPNF